MYPFWLSLLNHIVFLLVVLPIVGAILVLILGHGNRERARLTAVTNVVLTLVLAAAMFWNYQPELKNKAGQQQRWQMVTKVLWLAELQPVESVADDEANSKASKWRIIGPDIRLAFGADGVSALLLLVVPIISLLILAAHCHSQSTQPHIYFALLLLMESAVLANLAALDLVLYILSLESISLCCFFLIGRWGEQNRKRVVVKFCVIPFAASLFILLGLMGVVVSESFMQSAVAAQYQTPEFAIDQILLRFQSENMHTAEFQAYWQQSSGWIFCCLFGGIVLQLPLFPFHTWLPNAQQEAPYSVSIATTTLFLIVGIYPVIRFLIPVFSAELIMLHTLIACWCVLAAISSALLSLAQDDLKKKFLYAGLCSQCLCMLALLSLNQTGLAGAVLLLVSSTLAGGLLLYGLSRIEAVYEIREQSAFGGLMYKQPGIACLLVLALLALIAAPGLSGFPALLLVVIGVFQGASAEAAYPVLTLLALISWILMCWSVIWTIGKMLLGKLREPMPFSNDQSNRPLTIVIAQTAQSNNRGLVRNWDWPVLPAVLCILVMGIMPQLFLDKLTPSVQFNSAAYSQSTRMRPLQNPVVESKCTCLKVSFISCRGF